MKRALTVAGAWWLFVACGQHQEAGTSELNFRAAAAAYAGLTWQVERDTIRVCYSDPSDNERHRQDTVDSILTWIDPMRELADVPLAETVELVGPREDCQVKVTVGNFSPAYTRMGNRPEVFINYNGWFGSKTVTLHEFGHAFGLLDTYLGSGGRCQAGQPDSVMCRASYDELQYDDVDGIRYVYDQVRRGLVEKLPDDHFIKVY